MCGAGAGGGPSTFQGCDGRASRVGTTRLRAGRAPPEPTPWLSGRHAPLPYYLRGAQLLPPTAKLEKVLLRAELHVFQVSSVHKVVSPAYSDWRMARLPGQSRLALQVLSPLCCYAVRDWMISHALSHHIFPNTLQDLEVTFFEPLISFLPYSDKSLVVRYLSWVYSVVLYAAVGHGQFGKR